MTKGTLSEKGLIHFDSGFYMIRQPMPYPLGETNVYLLPSGAGWAVIDVGVDLPGTRQLWEQALKELGISFKQINRIYITHCHPDHLGAARWLQQCCDAPVYMLQEEIKRAQKYIFLNEQDYKEHYWQAICTEMKQHKFPASKIEELLEDWYREVRPLYLEPVELLPLEVGDMIDLAGNTFEVIKAAGHSDGQCVFWSASLRQLFLADVLAKSAYLHFTDWPNTELQNPLENQFVLLEQLKTMEVARAFPGHGPVIEDLNVQLDKLINKHKRILDKIEAVVQSPICAGDLYPHLFVPQDYVHHHRVILGETLGYLNYLASKGRLDKEINEDVVIYKPLPKKEGENAGSSSSHQC